MPPHVLFWDVSSHTPRSMLDAAAYLFSFSGSSFFLFFFSFAADCFPSLTLWGPLLLAPLSRVTPVVLPSLHRLVVSPFVTSHRPHHAASSSHRPRPRCVALTSVVLPLLRRLVVAPLSRCLYLHRVALALVMLPQAARLLEWLTPWCETRFGPAAEMRGNESQWVGSVECECGHTYSCSCRTISLRYLSRL